jgi:hypothetical protein
MFFPTYGLHRIKITSSPEITGNTTDIPVNLGLGTDGTILVLGNNQNSVPLIQESDGTILVLGNNQNSVSLSVTNDTTELIISSLDVQVPMTLQS